MHDRFQVAELGVRLVTSVRTEDRFIQAIRCGGLRVLQESRWQSWVWKGVPRTRMLRFHPHHSTLPTAHMLLLQYPLLYVMRGLADHRCAGVVLLTVQTVLYSERVFFFCFLYLTLRQPLTHVLDDVQALATQVYCWPVSNKRCYRWGQVKGRLACRNKRVPFCTARVNQTVKQGKCFNFQNFITKYIQFKNISRYGACVWASRHSYNNATIGSALCVVYVRRLRLWRRADYHGNLGWGHHT